MKTRKDFLARLTLIADMTGKTLNHALIAFYELNLKDLSFEESCGALDEIMVNRGDRDPFPSVKSIRERVRPPENPELDAVEAANRISEAISRFGYTNAIAAKAFVGELGWAVVERQGGWEWLCESVMAPQVPTLKAQWRESAKAIQDRARRGVLSEPPRLPTPRDRNAELVRIGSVTALNPRKDLE